MSVEATALSRSKLEQKDRGELAAIVEAMGGKPGSRAKKAELVDLVLELAAAPAPHRFAASTRVIRFAGTRFARPTRPTEPRQR